MKALTYCLVIGAALIGCSLLGEDKGPGELSPEELRSAPESITVDGKQLALYTYMWRDFMPISPPDGKALIAIFRVATTDSSALPKGLTSEAAWVVNGSSVWDAFFEAESPPQQLPYQLERIARNGPKWGPNVVVDAVVQVRESTGTTHLLRASNQRIDMTQ